ncbi:hypothetical protein B0H13DRAFT_2654993, partial [Mycena leptocephala]
MLDTTSLDAEFAQDRNYSAPTFFTLRHLLFPRVSPFPPSVLFLSRGTATPRLIHWLGPRSFCTLSPCVSSLPPSGLFFSRRYCDTSSPRLSARSALFSTSTSPRVSSLPPSVLSLYRRSCDTRSLP